MNNLARCLGVPLDIEDACALLGAGVTRQIDVGRVVSNAKPEVEYFLEAAGVGLSAIVIPTGQALEKGRWGVLPLALRKLFDTKPEPIQVDLDDEQAIHASSQIVTVSNAPMLGKNILIAPDAKMDDGYLDIAIYDEMTKTDLLQYFMAASNGQHAENPKIKFHRARRVRISANRELDANSDKDLIPGKQVLESTSRLESEVSTGSSTKGITFGGGKDYTLGIEIVPQALSVICGKGIGLSLPVEAVPAVPPLSGPQPQAREGNGSGNGSNP